MSSRQLRERRSQSRFVGVRPDGDVSAVRIRSRIPAARPAWISDPAEDGALVPPLVPARAACGNQPRPRRSAAPAGRRDAAARAEGLADRQLGSHLT